MLAACFLGFAAAASAQVSGIEGIVKDPDGKPIVGAVIKIERQDIKGNYTVKTDKKGHYGPLRFAARHLQAHPGG